MFVFIDSIPKIAINPKGIDMALSYSCLTHEEYCKKFNFDYKLFKRIYNNDLTVTLQDLISLANILFVPLRNFIIIS